MDIEKYRTEYRHLLAEWCASAGAELVDNPRNYMNQHVLDALMSTRGLDKEFAIIAHEAIEYEPGLVDAQFAIITLKAEHARMNQPHMLQSFREEI